MNSQTVKHNLVEYLNTHSILLIDAGRQFIRQFGFKCHITVSNLFVAFRKDEVGVCLQLLVELLNNF